MLEGLTVDHLWIWHEFNLFFVNYSRLGHCPYLGFVTTVDKHMIGKEVRRLVKKVAIGFAVCFSLSFVLLHESLESIATMTSILFIIFIGIVYTKIVMILAV
jgi:hypothetical protein